MTPDEESDAPAQRDRVKTVANVMFLSGVTFSALEVSHKRDVCMNGACSRMRRRGYSWAALVSYAGATVGYFWILGDRQNHISIGVDRSGALGANVSW